MQGFLPVVLSTLGGIGPPATREWLDSIFHVSYTNEYLAGGTGLMTDAQCAAGLRCFQRSNGETIPGCFGPGGGSNWDYCYDPASPTRTPDFSGEPDMAVMEEAAAATDQTHDQSTASLKAATAIHLT